MNYKSETEFVPGQRATEPAREPSAGITPSRELHPARDLVEYCREYARERPAVVALWCFGLGFVLGWKLKPW